MKPSRKLQALRRQQNYDSILRGPTPSRGIVTETYDPRKAQTAFEREQRETR